MTNNPLFYGIDKNPSVLNQQPISNAFGMAVRHVRDMCDIDAFGVQRVSQSSALFESTCQYGKIGYLWEDALTGGGTTTHNPNSSSVSMAVGTASGDKVIRQTHRYIRYSPHKGHRIDITRTFAPTKTNLRQRTGYFDAQNGLYFELTMSGLSVNVRSYTSGSVVNTQVFQSNWNVDKFDGTGQSGINLDITKNALFIIDFGWQGIAPVRFGFLIAGRTWWAHIVDNGNLLTVPYMTTGTLPLRDEIENTGVTASVSTMLHVCSSVISEGGIPNPAGIHMSASNGITTIGVTTRRPILSIRPRLLFNSIVNRIPIIIHDYALRAITNDSYFEVVYNGTLTGASFADVDTTNSSIQKDVSASAISGGMILDSGHAISGGGSGGNARAEATRIAEQVGGISLALDIAGSVQDTLTIVCTSFSGTSNIVAEMSWVEMYA